MLTLNQRINKIKDDIISQTSGLQNVLGNKVSTSGNQTIRDIKTFTSTIDGNINGNAGTVTNGVYRTGDQTIDGNKHFQELRQLQIMYMSMEPPSHLSNYLI